MKATTKRTCVQQGRFVCLTLLGLLITSVFITGIWPARADDAWPSKAITVVVGFAAGGNTDLMARLAAQKLSSRVKQPVVIDNRPGAGGSLAATYASQAAPDGYTLLFAASPQIVIGPQMQKVGYDPVKDFAPISSLGSGPSILSIRSSLPAKTFAEFVDYAKRNSISYGSGGVGTISHLLSAFFISRAGINGVHVPFRGSGLTTTAVLGGQIDMYFANASDVMPYKEDNRINLLAVAARKRMTQLPAVPTIEESYPGSNIPSGGLPSWNGLFAPSATPTSIIQMLATHMMAIAKEPDVVARLEQSGIVPEGTSPDEFRSGITSDLALFAAAIKAANIPAAN